ncbi:MAG: glutamate--tRNA ligase [Synergistaceae bacterium]|nr:glutamate--tRNA ligase [Synergistaceae bacterium]
MEEGSENSEVVTRFAPSPTGSLHIGGARTALFNYLWARRREGKFLLRFEDTDMARSSPEHEESILNDLRWLGIKPDGEVTRQTENQTRHRSVLDELVRLDVAYPCFCPHSSLGDSHGICHCGRIPQSEALGRAASGQTHCWRFRARCVDGIFRFTDRLRGSMEIAEPQIGDFVLARGDGSMTYLFAVVVDDHDSSVTHVIRGEEHLPNTPKQEMIYRALGWDVPEWVHIPMILDSERHKLSKRSGAISIGSYREAGWLPEAVVSYIATLSWAGAPADELKSPLELSRSFDLDSVALTSPIHDPERMRHFGRMSIASASPEEVCAKYDELFPYEPHAGEGLRRDREALVAELAPSCATIDELGNGIKLTFLVSDALLQEPHAWIAEAREFLIGLREDEWTSDEIKNSLKRFQKERGLKSRDLYHTLRVLVTGREAGAPLTLIMSCLGRERSLERMGR